MLYIFIKETYLGAKRRLFRQLGMRSEDFIIYIKIIPLKVLCLSFWCKVNTYIYIIAKIKNGTTNVSRD